MYNTHFIYKHGKIYRIYVCETFSFYDTDIDSPGLDEK